MVFAVNPSATKTFDQFQVSSLLVLLNIFEMMVLLYSPTLWAVARAPLLVDPQVPALLAHPPAVVHHLPPLAPKGVVPSELVAVPLVS